MAKMYERLERDCEGVRAKFMSIPLIAAMVGTPPENAGQLMGLLETGGIYQRFLVESYYHVRAAAKVYALAGSRVSQDDEAIRIWLMRHAVDEYGHHEWIENDLRAMGFDVSLLAKNKPSIHSDALVAWMYYIAGTGNPIAVLADSYVIEGLSQLFATQVAETIQANTSISKDAMSYIVSHGILDQGHMDELRDLVNSHVKKESDYQDMLQCAKVEFELYGRIMEHISEGIVGSEPKRRQLLAA